MLDKTLEVTRLPLTRERASAIVRDIADDSSRWAIAMPYDQPQQWRELVNRRQIALCIRDGYILENHARLDPYGNWRFQIARVCGGLHIVIDVALESEVLLPKLFVVGIRGDEIQGDDHD